ncbi:HvfC family RiPP maturation protein [Rheinheimera baltica]|uniref:HvfC family RiPP maturation protein n=1 Tax=Rheinheimera baltica TaxID=67576 RepID=UPI00273FFBD8|nr:putative DNA-binding domain-containing protein [Rheinheimera baltica]MDP5150298.1 putative DNA-binding domain-containing protein [Rheinheimera baltica]
MQFQQIQHAFINHIKDPEGMPIPEGVADSRMAVYRELFFNNVQSFVSSAFPVLKSLYSEVHWLALVRHFFKNHQCTSPYFLDIAEHFLQYLQQSYQITEQDPEFLLELAHYEWVELYLATKPLKVLETPLLPEQVNQQPLALSALALVLVYHVAVHQISVDFKPAVGEPEHCYLLYRNSEDDVKFVAINQLTALLLQTLQQMPGVALDTLVQQLVPLLPQFNTAQLMQGAQSILQDFATKGVLVSFQE